MEKPLVLRIKSPWQIYNLEWLLDDSVCEGGVESLMLVIL